MHTQELEWNKDMVTQYGVTVCIPERVRLEIPLHHFREVCSKPGGLVIKQLPEFIQFQQDAIRMEQAQEIEHFNEEEQSVFGSHLIPYLYLERLTADSYQGLSEIIHRIGKPYCDWTMADYLMLTDTIESMSLDAGDCEVHRRPRVNPTAQACLIYDAKDTLRAVGILDNRNLLSSMEPAEFFGLVQSIEGLPLYTEAFFVEYCIAAKSYEVQYSKIVGQ